MCALKEIKTPQPFHFPAKAGYEDASIEFVHDSDCAVQLGENLPGIKIERQDDRTLVVIPPDPACDRTSWLVGCDGGP
jgi:hypothetical protein